MPYSLEPFLPHTPAFLEVVSVYQQVWGGNPEPSAATIEFFLRQTVYPEWRGLLARGSDGTVLGFACGSVVRRGQWWHDHLQTYLQLEGAWCLVELAVLESARRHGIAQALHDLLLQPVQQPQVVLSTQINNMAAIAFYRQNHYRTLLERIVFTPSYAPYIILGKQHVPKI